MGRLPRSKEEVELIKNSIIEEALHMIAECGYDGFSIRKLGPKLGVAPKTVYNYFQNKDEVYLHVLTRGFEILFDELCAQAQRNEDPYDKLVAMVEAFARFGFQQSNYYDIMFTLHVPKFNDYVGTPLEGPAHHELTIALKSLTLFIEVMEELSAKYGIIEKDDARISVVQLFVGMHGIVSLNNNSMLDYVHDPSQPITDQLLHRILAPFNPHPS